MLLLLLLLLFLFVCCLFVCCCLFSLEQYDSTYIVHDDITRGQYHYWEDRWLSQWRVGTGGRGGGGGRISSRLLLITFTQALFSALQQTYTSPFVVCLFLVHAGLFDYFHNPLSDRLGNRSFGCMSSMYGSSVYTVSPEVLLYGILMPVLDV